MSRDLALERSKEQQRRIKAENDMTTDEMPECRYAQTGNITDFGTFTRADMKAHAAKQVEKEVARIATQLRAAGATLPAPCPNGTIESAMNMGLCIALAIVEDKP